MSATTRLAAFSPSLFAITAKQSTFLSASSSRKRFSKIRATIRAADTINPTQKTSYETGKITTNIRVFLDASFVAGQTLPLNPIELRHLRARRARDGDMLLLFNNTGHTATAVLQSSDAVVLRVSQAQPQRPSIAAVIGLPKSPKRADWIVEKLTELGVTSIYFSRTARAADRLSEAKLQRWRRLAVAAAKQSLRTEMPGIYELPFDHVVKEVEQHTASLLFCSGGQPLLAEECVAAVKSSSSALLLIGPEGGFVDEEIEALLRAGAVKVGLGDLRLRVETAAVVAAGVVTQLFVQGNCATDRESG